MIRAAVGSILRNFSRKHIHSAPVRVPEPWKDIAKFGKPLPKGTAERTDGEFRHVFRASPSGAITAESQHRFLGTPEHEVLLEELPPGVAKELGITQE